ncbi:hypothetical protein IAT38_002626 [Cryptococcus sp. DSM 104549]
MTSPEAPIGAKVQVSAGIGHVRWSGSNPAFAAGKWVGVELLEPGGKNDGSVKGDRYFQCKPNHGVFVRPSQVKVLEAPPRATPSRPSSARPPATPTTSRLASTSSSRAASPQKPPSRAAPPATPPRAVSGGAASSTASPGPSAAARRISSASAAGGRPIFKRPPSALGDPSAGRAPTPLSAATEESELMPPPPVPPGRAVVSPPPVRPASRQVVSPTREPHVVSPTPSASARPGATRSFSSSLAAPPELSTSPETPSHFPTASGARGSLSRSPSPEKDKDPGAFSQKRELEELRIKVRILENRKHEDQEKLRDLESRVGEADTLRAARVRLQSKFQELQSSLVSAQRTARDLASENAQLEVKAAEALDQLEMAALDREVAEEKAEAAEMEVGRLGERVEELELEVAVLKEENAEYETPVSGLEGERTSLAFVQLEKHNERLKDALIRLRDVSSEAEREHKTKMAELEKELTSQDDLFSQLELAEAKLSNAEAQVEDLKQQLDDALGAEDMLEQLTERNLQMGERIEEMRVTIEDLEALKDLNDELEENHVEAEKQLNEEIDTLTAQLRDEQVRSGELDSVILDMEATINQFRELVANLQSELEAVRMQQATQESSSATNSKEAQALLNLNLKLQSTAVKAQSKTIDLELKNLEAAQLAEHMRIVHAFLPEAYHETEADSTSLFLFFSRVAAKLEMLIGVISQVHRLPASLYAPAGEVLVGVCEVRGKLRHFSNLNKRFGAVMQRSSTEEWVGYGRLVGEVAGVEGRVDGWLALIKSDEFNEGDCERDLGSLIAQFDHLAETAFNRPLLDVGEQQLGLAYSFDCDLDNFAAAVGFARQQIALLTSEEDIEVDVGDSSLEEGVYDPVQRILDLVRTVKVPSGKLVAQIEEVVQASGALQPEGSLMLGDLATSVSNAVDLAVQLAQRIGQHVATIRSTKSPLRLSDIETFLHDVTAQSASAGSDAHPWDLIGMFISKLGEELGGVVPKVKAAVKAGQVVTLTAPPPWLARVAAIKEAASHNADTEKQVVKLSEELKDMLREIKIRDQNLQESGVKVETLERRLEASRKQADVIIELENDVAKAKKQEKVYEDAIEQLQAEQDALEAENARLRKGQGQGGDRQANTATTPGGTNEPLVLGSGAGLESSQLAEQVDNLRSAVRFLRAENAMLKSKEMYKELHAMPALRYRAGPGLPELVPSVSPGTALASGSSSESESEGELPTTPTLEARRGTTGGEGTTAHALEVESKILLHQMARFQASAKVVDISQLGAQEGWRRRKEAPEMQMWEWRKKEKRLERKLEGLVERARGLGGSRL